MMKEFTPVKAELRACIILHTNRIVNDRKNYNRIPQTDLTWKSTANNNY